LIEEGAALYVHPGMKDTDSRLLTGGDIGPGVLRSLLDDRKFRSGDLFVVYQVAQSFASFLISEYGMENFKSLYGAASDAPEGAFGRIYGKPLDDLETEWQRFVAAEMPEGRQVQE
jgi:hypothetical protein